MNTEFIYALKQIERERTIPMDLLLNAIEDALAAAYKRNFGPAQNVCIEIDRQTGAMRVLVKKNVVTRVADPQVEITLSEARKIDPKIKRGEELVMEITPTDFGRIAAQTAKQVIVQRIREAERDIVFSEFTRLEGSVISGVVQRYEQRNCLLDMGKAEGIIPLAEQVPTEHFRHGDRVKGYALEVKKTTRGTQVVLSRSHPDLIKKLFDMEVPEIRQGLIDILGVVREPGYRSKIAVKSKDSSIDPIGACVGPRGSRVQAIVDELRGEKIDIINWNPDPRVFISNSLSPAKVLSVTLYESEKSALIVVPDHQLSLAIGKEGQNARLAAKLTGWKIDIKSESQAKAMEQELAERAARAAEEAARLAAEEEAARAAEEAARLAAAEAEAYEVLPEAAEILEPVIIEEIPEGFPEEELYVETEVAASQDTGGEAIWKGKKKKKKDRLAAFAEDKVPRRKKPKGPKRRRRDELEEDYEDYY